MLNALSRPFKSLEDISEIPETVRKSVCNVFHGTVNASEHGVLIVPTGHFAFFTPTAGSSVHGIAQAFLDVSSETVANLEAIVAGGGQEALDAAIKSVKLKIS